MAAFPPDRPHALAVPGIADEPPGLQILLIEDDPDFSAVLRTFLELDAGFQVRCAGSVASGLESFDTAGADLILLDLGLPDFDGLATLGAVRRGAPSTPVVVLTGADDEMLAMEAVRRGAQDIW